MRGFPLTQPPVEIFGVENVVVREKYGGEKVLSRQKKPIVHPTQLPQRKKDWASESPVSLLNFRTAI